MPPKPPKKRRGLIARGRAWLAYRDRLLVPKARIRDLGRQIENFRLLQRDQLYLAGKMRKRGKLRAAESAEGNAVNFASQVEHCKDKQARQRQKIERIKAEHKQGR